MGDSTIDSAVVNQGTLCAGVDSTINGQLTAPSGSTLEVGAGSVPFIYDVPTSALNLDITQGFTNHGQIDLYNVSLGSTLTVTNGALLNAADGTIDSLPGLGTQGLANTLDADLDNQGAINVTGADLAINPSTGTPADTPTDTGRTTVSAGRLLINSANALSDDGSLSIGAGGTFIFDPSITAANAAATAPNGTPVAKPQLPPAMPRNQSVLHRTIGSGLLPSPQSVPSSSSHTPAVDQAVRSSFAPRAAGSPAWLGQTADQFGKFGPAAKEGCGDPGPGCRVCPIRPMMESLRLLARHRRPHGVRWADYRGLLVRGLPSDYHLPYSAENYEIIRKRIDNRFQQRQRGDLAGRRHLYRVGHRQHPSDARLAGTPRAGYVARAGLSLAALSGRMLAVVRHSVKELLWPGRREEKHGSDPR